jgi:hypothetical protein
VCFVRACRNLHMTAFELALRRQGECTEVYTVALAIALGRFHQEGIVVFQLHYEPVNPDGQRGRCS